MFALLEQVDGSIPLYTSHVRARTDGPGLMKSGRSIKALIWWYWNQARICSMEETSSAPEPELGKPGDWLQVELHSLLPDVFKGLPSWESSLKAPASGLGPNSR